MDIWRYVLVGLAVYWSTRFVFLLLLVTLHVVICLLKIMMAGFVTWAIVFLTDLVYSELITAWRNYRRRQSATVTAWPRWEVVTFLRPSANESLEKVICCDTDRFDDPLYPHVSLVYEIGIKYRSSFWREVIIWRISTLTGHRRRVCRFKFVSALPSASRLQAYAFYSRGVIFVYLSGVTRANDPFEKSRFLLVYDLRHQKQAEIPLRSSLCISKYARPLAIFCLARRLAQNQAIDGWRIRFLGTSTTRNDELERRTVFFKAAIDLSISEPGASITVAEDLLFPCTRDIAVRSECRFGLYQRQGSARVFVYDATRNRFQVFPSLLDFLASNTVLREYCHRRVGSVMLYLAYSNPIAINDREAILTKSRETVFMRTWFKAPTLRMLAARAVFKTHPNLATMAGDQFRELTGVDLDGHLG